MHNIHTKCNHCISSNSLHIRDDTSSETVIFGLSHIISVDVRNTTSLPTLADLVLSFLQIGALNVIITGQEDRRCEPRFLHLGSFSHHGLGGRGPGRLLTRKNHYPESRAGTRWTAGLQVCRVETNNRQESNPGVGSCQSLIQPYLYLWHRH
jgi:hypothetical protein